MKRTLCAVIVGLLFFAPFAASAHPGKTDRYGGHKCIKGCEEWKLYFKEYHLHDKQGRAIRTGNKSNILPELISMPTETPPLFREQPVTAPTVTVYQYVQILEREALSRNPLLWVLVVLLLLWLIVRSRREKTDR